MNVAVERAQALLDEVGDAPLTIYLYPSDEIVGVLRELIAEVERLHSWDGLMSLLDEHYPVDIFPTEPDGDDRDPGPRIISLVRYLDAARAGREGTSPQRLRAAADAIEALNAAQGFALPARAVTSPHYIRREAERIDREGI